MGWRARRGWDAQEHTTRGILRTDAIGLAPARHATVMTTLPRLWSVSTYRWAAAICSSG